MPSLPVQRTLEALRREGWTADVSEKWIAFSWKKPGTDGPPGVRKDLFGFVDVVAYHPEKGILFVQASPETGQVAKHVDKLLLERRVEIARAIRAGARVEIHGWGKKGPRGKAKRWTRRRMKFAPMGPSPLEAPPPTSDQAWGDSLTVVEVEGEP